METVKMTSVDPGKVCAVLKSKVRRGSTTVNVRETENVEIIAGDVADTSNLIGAPTQQFNGLLHRKIGLKTNVEQ